MKKHIKIILLLSCISGGSLWSAAGGISEQEKMRRDYEATARQIGMRLTDLPQASKVELKAELKDKITKYLADTITVYDLLDIPEVNRRGGSKRDVEDYYQFHVFKYNIFFPYKFAAARSEFTPEIMKRLKEKVGQDLPALRWDKIEKTLRSFKEHDEANEWGHILGLENGDDSKEVRKKHTALRAKIGGDHRINSYLDKALEKLDQHYEWTFPDVHYDNTYNEDDWGLNKPKPSASAAGHDYAPEPGNKGVNNPYALLHIEPTASNEEIGSAFRKLSLILHPDRPGTGDTEKFKELNAAYETIRAQRGF